jgi:hypothetical protein
MIDHSASSITKAASKHTYYTIRFWWTANTSATYLAAMFRWVDDRRAVLQGSAERDELTAPGLSPAAKSCWKPIAGQPPRMQYREKMLVDWFSR